MPEEETPSKASVVEAAGDMSSSLRAVVGSSAGDRGVCDLAIAIPKATGDAASESLAEPSPGSALEAVAAMRRGREGRPPSPKLLGALSGPFLSRPGSGAHSRSGSMPGTSRALACSSTSKAMQDTNVLAVVRRQMDSVEEKLMGQINRVQQQSDRLRDAALSRVDSKMLTMEAMQPKLDRRLAELSGNYKGLSDEMQAQIRRLDQMDSRLWEWRHQLEEEVRSKLAEMEQKTQKATSSMRVMTATNEDSLKRHNSRLDRIERLVEERLQTSEDTDASLMGLHERLEQLESSRLQELALAPSSQGASDSVEAAVDSVALIGITTRLSDSCSQVEALIEESRDIHMRLEAQEERLKSLHTRVESREEHHRWLTDRVERVDWQGRLKEIQSQLQECDRGRMKQSEDLELLATRVGTNEQASHECSEQIRQLCIERQFFATAREAAADVQDISADLEVHGCGETLSAEVKECGSRMERLEAKSDCIVSELDAMKADVALAPRVAALVNQLKDVAPKVIEQEMCVRELLEKVAKLEVEEKMKSTVEQSKLESSTARMQRLEADVERLSVNIESLVKA